MNYSMVLFTGVLVVGTLFFLQSGGGGVSCDSQVPSSLTVQNKAEMSADKNNETQESDLSWLDASSLLNSQIISPRTSHELIAALKKSGIWQTGSSLEVAPLVVTTFPDDLIGLEVGVKKKVFLGSLLPAVLVVKAEVQSERNRISNIFSKLGCEPKSCDFSEMNSEWRQRLSNDELLFVADVIKKYRSSNGAELLERINVLPVSLVLAQGALESSWGTSRFARLGNNIFGLWTWGKDGIVPLKRSEGMTHKIARYDSVLDSVRAYILNINRLPAYGLLREMRVRTMDSLELSNGLLAYSERREEYVREIQNVISYNGLSGYDQCRLLPSQEAMPLVAMRDN